MTRLYVKWLMVLLAALIVGCAVEKPADVSNPKKSIAWIKSALKQATKTNRAEERIQWLIDAYDHAAQLDALEPESFSKALGAIPQQVYTLSKQTGNLEAFGWAHGKGAQLNLQYAELIRFWTLGPEWQDFILAEHPEAALPIFMSQAIDDYNGTFFDQHISAFKKTGYRIKSPLESTEFNVRFCRYIAEEIDEAIQKKDHVRISFLIDHTPAFPSVLYIDRKTKESMRALGDYVLLEMKDEALACKLIKLGYALNPIDLDQTGFGSAFTDALRTNPDYALTALHLQEWTRSLSQTEACFLLTLPDETLRALHPLYLDEAIKLCMKYENSEGAMRFIALREKASSSTRSDYTELMNWALEFGNQAVFDYVMERDKEIDLFKLKFALLAQNQHLFLQHAPQIMSKIYYSMDTHPRDDGTTIGQIYDVFKCSNEDAGLYIVQKYNLSQAWTKATQGRTLLMDVCHAGNLKAARYLIEKRQADIHAETGYSELQISIFGRNRPTEGKLSPIFFAAKSGDSELINYLVSKGAKVNARSNFGTTPLMHAVSAGHLDATQTLIALRANVNATMDSRFEQIDLREIGSFDEIETPYRRAERCRNPAILDLLIKAGARP